MNVDESLHDKIIDMVGTTPRMLDRYRNVHDMATYKVCNVQMNQDIDDLIDHLKDAMCSFSQKYESSVPKSLIWLSRASRQDEVLEDEIEDYLGSYVAKEFLTYLREEENAKGEASGGGASGGKASGGKASEGKASGGKASRGEASGGEEQKYIICLTYPSAYGKLINQVLTTASLEEQQHPIVQGLV